MALNIADLFEHAADRFPERLAIACGETALSFAQLDERANRLAHHLAKGGVGVGSHVGVYTRNSAEAMEALLAIYKLRAVAINVNYRYVEGELRYLFRDADLVALVHDERYKPLVDAVLPDSPEVRCVVSIGEGYEELLASQSPERDFGERSNDDLYILYTGGTTGYPKGVMWRHEDIWRVLGGGIDFVSGEFLENEWSQSDMGSEMVRLCAAPLIHGNAQWGALAALFRGDTVVMVPQFEPHEVWKAIERHQVNVIVLIGDAMARPLIEQYRDGEYDSSSIMAISSSAALFSPSVKKLYLELLPDIMLTEAIGSSETGFAGIGFVTEESEAEKTDGPRVMPGPQTIVIGDDGRPAPTGVVGRLARGGHVPIGYYKDPVKTANLLIEIDGVRYAMPGDLARMDDDGMITLLGRGNTCVNTGGEKVFPEEVEAALKSHPDVFDAVVIGLPDERLGQRVAALVQPRPGLRVDLSSLEGHVRQHVAGYKVPRSVWQVDEIYRTVSGKADYGWARKYADEHAEGALA